MAQSASPKYPSIEMLKKIEQCFLCSFDLVTSAAWIIRMREWEDSMGSQVVFVLFIVWRKVVQNTPSTVKMKFVKQYNKLNFEQPKAASEQPKAASEQPKAANEQPKAANE